MIVCRRVHQLIFHFIWTPRTQLSFSLLSSRAVRLLLLTDAAAFSTGVSLSAKCEPPGATGTHCVRTSCSCLGWIASSQTRFEDRVCLFTETVRPIRFSRVACWEPPPLRCELIQAQSSCSITCAAGRAAIHSQQAHVCVRACRCVGDGVMEALR